MSKTILPPSYCQRMPADRGRITRSRKGRLHSISKRVWCKNEDYWTVYFDLTEGIKKAFDQNDIEIPYPQMDVHVKQ